MNIRYVIVADNKEVQLVANRVRIRNEGGAGDEVIIDDIITLSPGDEIEFGSLDSKVKVSKLFRFFFPNPSATQKVVIILETI